MNSTIKVLLIILATIIAVHIISIIGGYVLKFAFGLAVIAAVYFVVKYYLAKETTDESKSR